MATPPITQIAINGTIYPELLDISTNAQKATLITPGESLFVTWYMRGGESVQSILALQNTTVSMSLLFANNNWVNNVLATLSIVVGKPARLTLSGASLGRSLLGKWNAKDSEEFFGENMTLQFTLQTPLTLFAPKVVATFY